MHVLPQALFVYFGQLKHSNSSSNNKHYKKPKLICNLFNQHSTHKQLKHTHTHSADIPHTPRAPAAETLHAQAKSNKHAN